MRYLKQLLRIIGNKDTTFFLKLHLDLTKKALPLRRFLKNDSLAQQVEHIPFKDGVLGSNPRRITNSLNSI